MSLDYNMGKSMPFLVPVQIPPPIQGGSLPNSLLRICIDKKERKKQQQNQRMLVWLKGSKVKPHYITSQQVKEFSKSDLLRLSRQISFKPLPNKKHSNLEPLLRENFYLKMSW